MNNRFILIFTAAYLFTVAMLFILQISEIPWFFFWLVLMHGGIVALAISKRKFKELDVKDYYNRAYLSFALFIPILIYKIVIAIIGLVENEILIRYISFGIILICLLVAIFNIYTFRKKYQ